MKKTPGAIFLISFAASVQAGDVQINIDQLKIQSGGTTINVGQRDKRGYYWDGKTWRDPVYWEKHHGHDKARSAAPHCPPGQAKKGNC